MDISQAKEELRRTVLAYNEKTEDGGYRVPLTSQRPMLLMGPPGIGKTAIVHQLAQEMGIGLVSYTMTHHTRQSALGLPLIREKVYDGKTYQATEYTMSEIIDAVYTQMEQTGLKQGILFLDEINCVSETLMPAMLQLLQSKCFGVHRLPRGWIIVAAGNPPQYNQAARDFDTVTLDRVRRLDITENLSVWQGYAARKGVHPAILSYLQMNPEHFYCVEAKARGRSFVTARGWEDLSQVLCSYEAMGFPVEDALFREFLQHEEIAAGFAVFYRLVDTCKGKLDFDAILSGETDKGPEELTGMRFDGRLAVVELLVHALRERLTFWGGEHSYAQSVSYLADSLPETDCMAFCRQRLQQREKALEVRLSCGGASEQGIAGERRFLRRAGEYLDGRGAMEDRELFASMQANASDLSRADDQAAGTLHGQMKHAMAYVHNTFGASQELLIFLTQLEALPEAKLLWKAYGETEKEELMDRVLPERLMKRL